MDAIFPKLQRLRRAIQRLVEDPVSERLLYKEFIAGQTIMVDVAPDPDAPGEQIFTFTGVEGFTPPPIEELAVTTGEYLVTVPLVTVPISTVRLI